VAGTTSVATPAAPVISVQVVKTNDADGNGTFTDSATAPAPGTNVAFRAEITNLSAVPVVIDSITDAYPGVQSFAVCEGLEDDVLAASREDGDSVTCEFSVPGYAPAAGASVVNVVTATVHEQDTDNTKSDDDTSSVLTATPPPADPDPDVPPNNPVNPPATGTNPPNNGTTAPDPPIVAGVQETNPSTNTLTPAPSPSAVLPLTGATGTRQAILLALALALLGTCTWVLSRRRHPGVRSGG
jgi:LPXTG-motif cell wall-anchored protein